MKIIDISKDIMTCEVFPGDPAPSLKKVKTIDDTNAKGRPYVFRYEGTY